MAVALRFMQWKLDDAAFKTGSGGLTPQECGELREELGELLATLSKYADETPMTVIEVDTDS